MIINSELYIYCGQCGGLMEHFKREKNVYYYKCKCGNSVMIELEFEVEEQD